MAWYLRVAPDGLVTGKQEAPDDVLPPRDAVAVPWHVAVRVFSDPSRRYRWDGVTLIDEPGPAPVEGT